MHALVRSGSLEAMQVQSWRGVGRWKDGMGISKCSGGRCFNGTRVHACGLEWGGAGRGVMMDRDCGS